ncbi:hypothetical protein K3495_g7971 [Podosphaera aphanis]|nr:hypothetical protein K3495_g7971 [Podosphaera aphanis]
MFPKTEPDTQGNTIMQPLRPLPPPTGQRTSQHMTNIPKDNWQDQSQFTGRQTPRQQEVQAATNRGGYNSRGGNPGNRGGKISNSRSTPPKNLSRNPYINGSIVYRREMGPLCLQCGESGHTKPSCSTRPLEWWEQNYLRELLWPSQASNFAGISTTGNGLKYREINESRWANQRVPPHAGLGSDCWRRSDPTDQQDQGIDQRSRNWRSPTPTGDFARPDVKGNERREVEFNHFTGGTFFGNLSEQHQSLSVVLGFKNRDQGKDALERKEKNVRFENDKAAPIVLDAYFNEDISKKRQRPMDVENLLNKEQETAKIRKIEIKRNKRSIRQLREILGRQGKGPIDYKKIAEEIKVELSLMDLFQMSPDLSKAFRSLSTRVNERKDKINNHKVKSTFSVEAQRLERHNQAMRKQSRAEKRPLVTMVQKAFRVPASIKTSRNGEGVNVKLPMNAAQADQGSDMIIVTVGLLKALNIQMKSLKGRGFDGMTMNVADGTSAQLTHYAEFEIGVLGIWRKVEAFVRPFHNNNVQDIHLLLGLPWLHAVDAKIQIRDSIIEIGDTNCGDPIMKIKGPKFVQSEQHRLVLCPMETSALEEQNADCEYDPSDDSEESISDFDDSSDDEGFGDSMDSELSEN